MRDAPVTRAAIVAAGLALLDEGGLGGLTLRRLAERLHIRAPTLYWHVRDKRELIGLLAEAIAADAADAFGVGVSSGDPAAFLHAAAALLAERLASRRDGAVVVAASAPALARLCHDEVATGRLVAAGCEPAAARAALELVSSHVLATVLRQSGAGRVDLAPGVDLVLDALGAGTPSACRAGGAPLQRARG